MSKMYKLIFDISICFLIGGFLLKYFFEVQIFPGDFPVLILSLLVIALFYKKRVIQTLLFILIPFIYLVIVSLPKAELIIFLLIWVYSAFIYITNRYVVERGELTERIRRGAVSFIILIILIIPDVSKFVMSIQAVAAYLVIALISAVFLMRHLRVENKMEQMGIYEKQQFTELIFFLFICVILTLLKVPQHIMDGFGLLYHYLLIPILSFLISVAGMLLYGILYLVTFVINVTPGNNKTQEIPILMGDILDQVNHNTELNTVRTFSVLPLLYLLGAAAGVVAVFFLFRWLMGNIYMRSIPNGIIETRESLSNVNNMKNAGKRKHPKNPREAVRYYYGRYMKWLQAKQVQLKASDTTSEIDHKYKQLIENDLDDRIKVSAALTDIYRHARYQTREEVSKEEAEKAKEFYNLLKNIKRKRK